MATKKRPSTPKKIRSRQHPAKPLPAMLQSSLARALHRRWSAVRTRQQNFLSRRPHRSFRWTRRRDLPRHAPLPSNIFFTSEVIDIISQNWRSYVSFLVIYVCLYIFLVGLADQSNYQSVTDAFKNLGGDIATANIDKTTQTLALFGLALTGGFNGQLTELQQAYIGLLSLFTWFSIVWFLRHRLKGVMVNVRDALYSCGSPLLASFIIVLIGLVQLVPIALAILLYMTLQGNQMITGVVSMLFGVATVLIGVLSLYWLTSTVFALIIVTLPGTYPLRALRMASDIVIGRRVSIMLRLLWLGFVLLLLWAFVLIPMILIAGAIPWTWLPVVPLTILLLTAFSLIFAASYVYLLYRRMIDEPVKTKRRA